MPSKPRRGNNKIFTINIYKCTLMHFIIFSKRYIKSKHLQLLKFLFDKPKIKIYYSNTQKIYRECKETIL